MGGPVVPALKRWEEPPDSHNETEFKKAVVDLFRRRGWRVHHGAARPARGKYITSGSPGFPDLVCLRPPNLLWLELKHIGASKARKDAEEQRIWIGGLQACGQHAYVVDEGAWAMLVDIARDGLKAIDEEEPSEPRSEDQ
jgi:hypothetical protein